VEDETTLLTFQRASSEELTGVVGCSVIRIASIGPQELEANVKLKVGALVLLPLATVVLQVITAFCSPEELPNREACEMAPNVSPVCVRVSPEASEVASVSEE
jgi:hypothetical protein